MASCRGLGIIGPCLDTGGGLWLGRSRGNTARKKKRPAAYHLVCGLLASSVPILKRKHVKTILAVRGFACSMPIDRSDRVAVQLGRDTKTVGVRKCYLYYAISTCSLADRRDMATPLQEDKKDDEDEGTVGKFHQMSYRDSDVREMHGGAICTSQGDTCKPQLKGAPNPACFSFMFPFLSSICSILRRQFGDFVVQESAATRAQEIPVPCAIHCKCQANIGLYQNEAVVDWRHF